MFHIYKKNLVHLHKKKIKKRLIKGYGFIIMKSNNVFRIAEAQSA